MIAIINRGEAENGQHWYTVGINHKVIAQFTHDRKKGLARCLRDAARAVDDENKLRRIEEKGLPDLVKYFMETMEALPK